MQKSVELEGKKYKAVIRGITFVTYRELFRKDLLMEFQPAMLDVSAKIAEIVPELPENADALGVGLSVVINTVDTAFLERIGYACLKAGDKSLPDFNAFMAGIDNYLTYITYCATCFNDIWATNFPVEIPEDTEKEKKSTN